MFSLQTESLGHNLEALYGADISVSSNTFSKPLPEGKLRALLETMRFNSNSNQNNLVLDYTFVTYSFDSFYSVTFTGISRLAGISLSKIKIYGLEDNFLSVSFPQYVIFTELNQKISFSNTAFNSPDLVHSLYSFIQVPKPDSIIGQQASNQSILSFPVNRNPNPIFLNQSTDTYYQVYPIILSENIRNDVSISAQDLVSIEIDFKVRTSFSQQIILATPVAMCSKFPLITGVAPIGSTGKIKILIIDTFRCSYSFYGYFSSHSECNRNNIRNIRINL